MEQPRISETERKKMGIMQPYFLPYLGYFQLINACDEFVLYDNIKFTKKGWIHRNRMLLNKKDMMFSLPLKNDSDFLNIDQRFIVDNFDKEKTKILGQIRSAYSKAVSFKQVYPLIEDIFNYGERNLFNFLFNSIVKIKDYLCIPTPLVVSSTIDMDHTLKGKERVMGIIKKMGYNTYINPIGGVELYNKEDFLQNGITLRFLKMRALTYPQLANPFIPSLSILDVMMFNEKETIVNYLNEYDLM